LLLETEISNLRYFKPKRTVRDTDNVVILVERTQGTKFDKNQNYINENWLVLFYKTSLSKYPVHVLKASDFGVNPRSPIDTGLVSIVHRGTSRRSDSFYISVYDPSAKFFENGSNSENLKNSLLARKPLRAEKKSRIHGFNVNSTYRWNILTPELISPSLDAFTFNTFKSKDLTSTSLRDILTSKNDPNGGGSGGDTPPAGKTHWVIWVCIILVVALIAGGVVYAIMAKTDEDDEYNNLEVEDGEAVEGGKKGKDAETFLTDSEYSRL
jgi:hypothetical protein